jgi:antitoxin component YwqK of YwqJK toxin-antitoxin module
MHMKKYNNRNVILLIPICIIFLSCKGQQPVQKLNPPFEKKDVIIKVFSPQITEYYSNNKKSVEIDTTTGYRKYWYENGNIKMEGKITKSSPKDYTDSVWKYYNELGQLTIVETYSIKGKLDSRKFKYFTNNKIMDEVYEYFEGDPSIDKTKFKFHSIEKMFYTNGQLCFEKHQVNNEVVEYKCWDPKGIPKPLDYLNTIKSLDIQE